MHRISSPHVTPSPASRPRSCNRRDGGSFPLVSRQVSIVLPHHANVLHHDCVRIPVLGIIIRLLPVFQNPNRSFRHRCPNNSTLSSHAALSHALSAAPPPMRFLGICHVAVGSHAPMTVSEAKGIIEEVGTLLNGLHSRMTSSRLAGMRRSISCVNPELQMCFLFVE